MPSSGWAVAPTGHPLSASVQVLPAQGRRAAQFVLAGRGVRSYTPGLSPTRTLRMRAGKRPFASTPALSVTDSGAPMAFVGCDDGALYAALPEGPRGGCPWLQTGLDIYSSPVLELQHRVGSVTFGSDDGHLYFVDPDREPVAGFPRRCEGFVSATPCVGDLDGDGRPEVMVGDWGGLFHAFRMDGSQVEGFPVRVGEAVWSSATLADIDGDGSQEVVFATRHLHALRGDGTPVAGFPRRLGSYAVASPTVVDFAGSGHAAVLVGSDMLYAFDGGGNMRRGFPVALDGFLWSSVVTAWAGAGQVAVAATWGGGVHAVRPDGAAEALLQCGAPVFSTPGLMAGAGGVHLAVAAWDGRAYARKQQGWSLDDRAWPTFHRTPANERVNPQRFAPPPAPPATPEHAPEGPAPRVAGARTDPASPRHRQAVFLRFDAEGLGQLEEGRVVYRVAGEDREHPTPLLLDAQGGVALVQPLGVGRRVRYHLEGATSGGAPFRYPPEGELAYTVERWGPLRIGALVARLEGRP